MLPVRACFGLGVHTADRQMSDFITERWVALAANLSSPNPQTPGSGAYGEWPVLTCRANKIVFVCVCVSVCVSI